MDRAIIVDHLELARRHVSEGQGQVARQRELVREMARDGHSTAEARKVLQTFEDTLASFKADRDRLIKKLRGL